MLATVITMAYLEGSRLIKATFLLQGEISVMLANYASSGRSGDMMTGALDVDKISSRRDDVVGSMPHLFD